ncbi:dipeptidyl-peptidase 3 family protein [Luteibaculum oceani]|uniref:Dihydrofolate reductase n=1 Tax=Luteibaculum oceani TaxID=1294296 RepID=A0A5C6UVR1_9FLAO|nr:dihydrofolate reductase [Luteibaculum oceani]TXC77059.1 dihydrofolate reductase [Luteibaculum oceani]
MKKILLYGVAAGFLFSCNQTTEEAKSEVKKEDKFEYLAEQFADLKILRYKIPQWDQLDLRQKKLVYFLTQSGYAGRDIMWDQNYRHNLTIRKALEKIVREYDGDKSGKDWENFMVYVKRVWFSNGIHHHYSTAKILPEFSKDYFASLLAATGQSLEGEVVKAIFDPSFDAKKVNLDPEKGLLKGSAVNFYSPDVTEKEVDAFYAKKMDKSDLEPISYGLNSRIAKVNGALVEQVYKVGGLYGPALENVISWLEKAKEVAENEQQALAISLLIDYYKTGDLKTWDAFNIAWVNDTLSEIDFIHGFVEVYNDPKGYRGSYESIIEIKDFEASERMAMLQKNTQWFEDNAPIMPKHKKEKVKGVSYKVVNVAGESGDASPSTPIGVNLPNANWIRANHGSKSVSLGNIVSAYSEASAGGILEEFAFNEEEVELSKKHGKLAGKLHTALHEVVGHASGKLEPGVGTPKETLKNYSSTIEEGRADLVALYYLMDQKMIDLGLMTTLDVGKAEYQSYIRNGLMLQLRRLAVGEDVEEAHMRNRQWISKWVYEKGKADNVIEKVVKEGKTYFVIRDYDKLRALFGELLKEVQRIKSQGDYEAAKNLVEGYGVKVDQDIHQEVLDRAAKFKSAPYGGFINPRLVPVTNDAGEITDVKVEYVGSFTEQMLEYAEKFGVL